MYKPIVSDGYLILYIICIIIGICILIAIAYQFGKIAESKGYDKLNWVIASFFLTLPVWLMIIALPNNIQHQELLSAIKKSQIDDKDKTNSTINNRKKTAKPQ